MPIFEAIKLALAQIRVQKLKSFFTLIGVSIGVMFLIAIVSIVDGVGRYVSDDLVGKLITKNSFELRQRPSIQIGDVDESEWRSWRSRPRLTEDDVPVVVAGLPPSARWSISCRVTDRRVALREVARWRSIAWTVTGSTSGTWACRVDGPHGSEHGARVRIERGHAGKFSYLPAHPHHGMRQRARELHDGVIGVAEKQGSAFGISLDKFALVPYRAPAHRLVNRFKVLDGLTIQSSTTDQMVSTMEIVRLTMRIQHRLRPGVPDDFSLQTQDSALAFWKKFQGYLVLAGIALPAIGLVVGSIVIMNIMLVAVAERTHEIGIRKALGARRSDILSQFLAESTTLAVIGASIGIAAGFGLAELIAAVSPLPAAVALWSVVVGVLVGATVGIVSGVYPATRAARLDPIAALRHET
jgi:putative ABC transport system permease protein